MNENSRTRLYRTGYGLEKRGKTTTTTTTTYFTCAFLLLHADRRKGKTRRERQRSDLIDFEVKQQPKNKKNRGSRAQRCDTGR